jgi:hypothetical protein
LSGRWMVAQSLASCADTFPDSGVLRLNPDHRNASMVEGDDFLSVAAGGGVYARPDASAPTAFRL